MEQSFRLHKPSVVRQEEQSSRVVMSLIFAAGAKALYSDVELFPQKGQSHTERAVMLEGKRPPE